MNPKNNDKTRKILSEILADLYRQQGVGKHIDSDSYLIAENGQYLGKLTMDRYDNNSIVNKYGPYRSKYSPTSVFNKYSEYGSRYGQFSLNNPYCTNPPKLFIKGLFKTHISNNKHVQERISPEVFFYNLENNLQSFIQGQVIESENDLRKMNKESFIEGYDGVYLGSLAPNQFNQNSIFNQFSLYGSQFSQSSIFNQFGPYGGQFSKLSPYNQFSDTPPKIFREGEFFAYLTANSMKTPRIDPKGLLEWAKNNINQFATN